MYNLLKEENYVQIKNLHQKLKSCTEHSFSFDIYSTVPPIQLVNYDFIFYITNSM